MLEVPRKQPGLRRFQVTEKTNRVQLMRDNPVKMLTLEVAIAHLDAMQQEQALKQSVVVSAEIEHHVDSLTKTCEAIFSESQLAQSEEVSEESALRQQPIHLGPDGWMA